MTTNKKLETILNETMNMKFEMALSIERIESSERMGQYALKVHNRSDRIVELHTIPKPPRRKVVCSWIIHPGQHLFTNTEDFNLEMYYVRFVKEKR